MEPNEVKNTNETVNNYSAKKYDASAIFVAAVLCGLLWEGSKLAVKAVGKGVGTVIGNITSKRREKKAAEMAETNGDSEE